MDDERARQLLAAERQRLEAARADVASERASVTESPPDPGDYDDSRNEDQATDEAVGTLLADRWAALERAEARLAVGTYGLSVLSGQPLGDERLEADPLAELTVEEAAKA
jgi:DnaK suppressor protein